MKKIYLDLNAISHIKEVTGLYDFIIKNLNHFVFVYSPAHFSDLMRSFKKDGSNTHFDDDLERLDAICETHLMRYDADKLDIFRCLPSEFMEKEGINYPIFENLFNFEFFRESLKSDGVDLYGKLSGSLKDVGFGKTIEVPFLGAFSNAWELITCVFGFLDRVMSDKNFVKQIRAGIVKDVKDKEIIHIYDILPKDVIGAINAFFEKYNFEYDFEKVIKEAVTIDQQGNEMRVFQSMYAGLDLLRYHADDKGLSSIFRDAEHAFYGSYCDVMVTNDKKMKFKTQAVYSHFEIPTKIISKEELMQYLKEEIINEFRIEEPLKEILSNQHIPEKYNEEDVYLKWTTLDNPFFGYFDKLRFQLYLSTGKSCLVFTKESRFTYFTETDKLFEIIKEVLREADLIESFENEYVEKFRANDNSATFSFDFGPTLQMVLAVCEEGYYLIPVMYLLPKPVSAQSK